MQNEGNWVLVTGAAKGLGAEICRTLAAAGFHMLIHYNQSHREAVALAEECRKLGAKAICIQGDFARMEGVNEFIMRLTTNHPPVANLVNNVGNYCIQPPLTTDTVIWAELYQTNLFAPLALINGLLPSIKNCKGGIINIGVVGIQHIPADVYATAYTSTKLALWMATKSYAKALASDGVCVNMVSPGMLDNSVDLSSDGSDLPMKRPAALHEAARVVAFLLNKDSAYITGQNIEVAGALRL